MILGDIKNNVIIQNSIFHHNYATKSGGFLFVVNLGLVSMKDSDIQHNEAKEVGGAIGGVNAYIYLTGTYQFCQFLTCFNFIFHFSQGLT
jgi:hypothetical protein